MNLFNIRKRSLQKYFPRKGSDGFSSNEMVVVLACIAILATMTIPLLTPVIELAEVLIAEKYLLGAVKECQMGLINDETYPVYTLPPQSIGIGFLTNRRFQFLSSGIESECLSSYGGNILSAERMNQNQTIPTYSLNINLITGEKTSEGDVPSFIDWWEGFYSPLIEENDTLLF